MNRVRFSTVQDVIDAFPTAKDDIGKVEPDMRSLDVLRSLIAKREWESAISLCCYLLSRRDAIDWACRSTRRMIQKFDDADDKALRFVEAWIAEPEEGNRRKALAIGNTNDTASSVTWLALAAGWSGGSVVPPEFGHVPASPERTARATRVALFIAQSSLDEASKDKIMVTCLEDGLNLAGGEPAASR